MNFLERALAAALKSAGEDLKEVVKEAGKKIDKFVEGVDKTIEELDEISKDGKHETKRK
jgi:phage-related minor tail protein